ncbi:LLM class F420-dependent oxidoreductase [Streptomyces cavernicola]|uniref:LLM class F420-dependent oxidoreductase n=1 Tax=Streptomyces cavernicola TaxID=3043613 RepID=A0ABT6SMM7_9ACTN|nr:LLM class F420-dependent oxidoreductase [Streptomyces sp. B-S-A6]MDI3409423.1 LLM class F420-dependent oxidoreductase [Streptomyces sp. B-S-A6]
MKFGVFSMNTDEGLDPLELAREAEGLGLESVFVPDHSHVPVRRNVSWANTSDTVKLTERDDLGESQSSDMPHDFYRNREQFTTLASMAAVTSTLKVGSGICLVVQRDPIFLAKTVASVDHMSNGRLIFGVGVGSPWNREEIRNHGTEPRTRMKLMEERMAAMQEIWSKDEAEYHGKFVDFDPICSWPKPVQKPRPPVFVGGDHPNSLDRVLAYGDGWMPGHHDDAGLFRARVAELQERAAAAGRGRMEITVTLAHLDCLDDYAAAGADRVLVMVPTGGEREVLKQVAEAANSF